jgi:hypothetical protein
MSTKESSTRGFFWKTGFFFLIILIGSIIAYDIYKHETFEGNIIQLNIQIY